MNKNLAGFTSKDTQKANMSNNGNGINLSFVEY